MIQHDILIIGSGFGGQVAAINLIKRGITDFCLLERRDFMGGTWCQNSYPGAAVDVQSPLYSISFEPYAWSQMFAEQDELQTYTEHVINKYGLREKTRTGCNVEAMRWDEAAQQWVLTTSLGECRARVVINASGPLSTPVIPNFPGRDRFQGDTWHTNNWRHDVSLAGKRVAIIGSGASAAQVIPAIAPTCGHLHVFQRTPHWVMPRPDRIFKPWQRALLGIKPLHKALRTVIYWQLETRVVGFKYSPWGLKHFAQKVAERHIRDQISDPALRAAVTPNYTIGCKRIILSNTLYPAFCRDNVTLHTQSSGIAAITETGIRTQDGQDVPLDVIIYSTGYDATDGVISYPVIGDGGRTLQDAWAAYPRAYLGTTLPGFPNLFIVTGPNTGIGHTSAIFVIEAQMNYIMNSLMALKKAQRRVLRVTPEAEAAYTDMIHREMDRTVWKSGGCHSWYQSKSGHVIAMFPGFSFTFRGLAKRFKPQHHVFS